MGSQNMTIILASKSPRRAQLVDLLGLPYALVASDAEEVWDWEASPSANVVNIAKSKAMNVLETKIGLAGLRDGGAVVVLGIDTVVSLGGKVFGKPANAQEAQMMLEAYCSSPHTVLSGVYMASAVVGDVGHASKEVSFCAETIVEFDNMDRGEIAGYVARDEIYDMAGAYGIQGVAARYIKGICGDYYNVMGFPANQIYRSLKDEFGLQPAGGRQ
ncbi:MAG: Maf family protein [Eubacteriaceae bacterium]|nr:Maf family protein [Eubacteriaceae bacterium]